MTLHPIYQATRTIEHNKPDLVLANRLECFIVDFTYATDRRLMDEDLVWMQMLEQPQMWDHKGQLVRPHNKSNIADPVGYSPSIKYVNRYSVFAQNTRALGYRTRIIPLAIGVLGYVPKYTIRSFQLLGASAVEMHKLLHKLVRNAHKYCGKIHHIRQQLR
jgi:hypothetical protein